MAQARLAAMRAQQQAQRGESGDPGYGDSEYSDSSYPPQASSNPYQPRRTNPFAQQDGRQDSYQMSEVQNSSANLMSSSYPPAGSGGGGDMTAFYAEIGSIQDALREFNDSVARIGDLHNRSLNNTDDAAAARVQAELDALVDQTSARSQTLKGRIQALARMPASGRDVQIKRQQTQLVREKFKDAIQSYQQVEQQFRQRYKQRMERQFKIVKPDATPDEIRAVVEDTQGGQVFQQALLSSNRYGEGRAAYREVQERHEDIKKIEQTLTELAQLFNDMSVLVEQQDEQITQIETTAMAVETDMEVGVQYQDKAIVSATNARKGRKICFAITAVVAIIIIIIIVVKVILPLMNKGNDKSAPASSSAATSAAASTAKAAVAATATAARRAIAGRILLPAPTPVPVF